MKTDFRFSDFRFHLYKSRSFEQPANTPIFLGKKIALCLFGFGIGAGDRKLDRSGDF
jgi:hypothetical protein